jgi:dihydroflavonol-4-reductase
MTALVTGATGFVGAAVARALVVAGRPVRVLARPASDRRNLAGLDVEIAEGDLRDPASLARAVKGCDALYHVAADYRLWVPKPAEIYAANVDGSTAILRAALDAGVGRIVYTSSVAVLGFTKDGTPSTEDTPVALGDMIGHYKRSKYLAEEAVRALVAEHKAPVVIVNPSTPIGPGDIRPTPTGRMVLDAARGKMPAYVDTGLNVVHVDDVAAGHLLAFEKGRVGERYILGGEDMSLQAIFAEAARLAGRKPPRMKLPHWSVMPVAAVAEVWARLFGGEPIATMDSIRMAKKKMFYSSAKARRELGYAPRPAAEALADAVAWFRDNGYLDG